MSRRRIPMIAAIVVLVGALVLADRASTPSAPSDAVLSRSSMPVATPRGAISSAFYCAGGAATAGALFDTTLVVANSGDAATRVSVTSYPAALPSDAAGVAAVAALQPVKKVVDVGARSRAEIHLADLQPSPFAAAIVETHDPGIAVEQRVVSADKASISTTSCASAPSTTWYFPTGTTTSDARELLAVFNPFPVDAVVDITFQTSDGFRDPPDLQTLPVEGGRVRIVDVSASVPRIEQLAATVVSRRGRVVVGRLQSFGGADDKHPAGFAATLGAPSAAPVWTFPEGIVADGISETYTVSNPTGSPVSAQLEIALDDPGQNGFVDPIPVTVPARGYAQLLMNDQTRVPPNVPHSVTVRSLSGGGVIAERVITQKAPAGHRGYAPAIGSPLMATTWLFADGRAAPGKMGDYLLIVNPSTDAIAHLRVTALAQGEALPVDGLQDVEVAAGSRLTIPLAQHITRDELTVLVTSDQPVVIERGLYAGGGKGISLNAGVPLPETVSVPPLAAPSTTTTTVGELPPPPPSS